MLTKILLGIILISILAFSSIACKKITTPIEAENKSPIIVSDSWSVLPGSPGNPIWAMSISSEGVFYAGIKGGLVRSFDNGLTWEQIYSAGTPNVIYVSPYDSMIILSLTGTFITTTVYSTDNGLTWEQSIEQPKYSSINHYLSLPSGEILAGGFVHDESSGGMFISKNKCATWKRIPDLEDSPSVWSFALNSENDVYAVISSGFSASTTSIYCSKDEGESWSKILIPDSLVAYNLVINKRNELIISTNKNIFISESSKDNWKSLFPSYHDGSVESLGFDSNDNLIVSFSDREDKTTKVLLFSGLSDNWYSIEGLNFTTSYDNTALVGKDHYIYLYTFENGIYKTTQSIDEIFRIN